MVHRSGVQRRPRVLVFAIALIAIGTAAATSADPAEQFVQTEQHRVAVSMLTAGLENPWGLAFLPDGRMLVTERPGRLRIVQQDGRLDPQPVSGLPPITAHGQGGLLDVALHPRFEDNRWVYLSYSGEGRGGIGTEVARGQLRGHELTNVEVLFRLEPKSGAGRHFGSRLVFDREGYLYITLGDRGDRPRAQRLDDHAGSVIRLHDDGRVPADNPFVARAGARPEIYTYGNRNLQGAALNPWTGELWTHEHGPQGGDEINIMRPGVNYGWPVITYGVNYVIGTKIGEGTEKAGMEQPIWYWDPSIAPSGMAFYDGDAFSRWRGSLFVGALKDRMLVRLDLDGDKVVGEERMLEGTLGRIRDVRVGPEGLIYLLIDARDGGIARLEPAND